METTLSSVQFDQLDHSDQINIFSGIQDKRTSISSNKDVFSLKSSQFLTSTGHDGMSLEVNFFIFQNKNFNIQYSHSALTGTLLTGTHRPNWNIFLGSVFVSLTGTVKNVLFELMYISKRPKKAESQIFFGFQELLSINMALETLRRL
jgi:hypothetical protein